MSKSAKKTQTESAAVNKGAKAADTAEVVLSYEAIVDMFRERVKGVSPAEDARVAAQVKIYGDVEGILYVLIADKRAVVEPFDYKGADIEIEADAAAFVSVLKDKKKLAEAITDGNIKMQGNAGKAIVLAAAVF